MSLRTSKDEMRYLQAKLAGQTTPLHKEQPLKEWQYWAVIDNRFPYSLAFKTHHLLIPKRVVIHKELSHQELTELDAILEELSDYYDCQLINFQRKQSIVGHFHIHLLVYKDQRS